VIIHSKTHRNQPNWQISEFFDLLEKEAYLSTANIIEGSCAKNVPPAARTQFINIGFQRTTQTLFTI
jgi:hypothetical protein